MSANHPIASVNPMAALSWPIDEEFQMYQDIGAEHIGYNCRKADKIGWSDVAAAAYNSGLRVDYLCHGLSARADDEAARGREIEFLRRCVRAGADLGASTIFVTCGR